MEAMYYKKYLKYKFKYTELKKQHASGLLGNLKKSSAKLVAQAKPLGKSFLDKAKETAKSTATELGKHVETAKTAFKEAAQTQINTTKTALTEAAQTHIDTANMAIKEGAEKIRLPQIV